ncbi:rho GTPase-activating protein 30 isoform X2 [Columba livia]|uniref:rho GTPase-activating protein 30 isoform X2 n=1 Tax=Columba livia TaxID=8932 RepID=UPI0031BB6374
MHEHAQHARACPGQRWRARASTHKHRERARARPPCTSAPGRAGALSMVRTRAARALPCGFEAPSSRKRLERGRRLPAPLRHPGPPRFLSRGAPATAAVPPGPWAACDAPDGTGGPAAPMSLALKARQRARRKGGSRERVFGCDLREHLQQAGTDVPQVLRSCTEFVEQHGVVDGIYRLSGVSSNIQRLRQEFEGTGCPDLRRDIYLQDIHCVSSLLKSYFRELPNPLLTYQLYDKFADAVATQLEEARLVKIKEVLKELPPPHYRTLEFLMRHLLLMASHSGRTNMHARNLAIVWAPNLLRSRDIEVTGLNGTAAFLEVRVQAIVVEFVLTHVPQLFGDAPLHGTECPRRSLLLPGGGQGDAQPPPYHVPATLSQGDGPPPIRPYHTIIELGDHRRKGSLKARNWRSIFHLGRSGHEPKRKPGKDKGDKCGGTSLRPAKSMDSLSAVPCAGDPGLSVTRPATPPPRRESFDACAAPGGTVEVTAAGTAEVTPAGPDPGGESSPPWGTPRAGRARGRAEHRGGVHISGPFAVTVPFHISASLSRLTRGLPCPALAPPAGDGPQGGDSAPGRDTPPGTDTSPGGDSPPGGDITASPPAPTRRDIERHAGDTEHSTGDIGHSTGDTGHSTGDTESSTGDTEHSTGDTQPCTGEGTVATGTLRVTQGLHVPMSPSGEGTVAAAQTRLSLELRDSFAFLDCQEPWLDGDTEPVTPALPPAAGDTRDEELLTWSLLDAGDIGDTEDSRDAFLATEEGMERGFMNAGEPPSYLSIEECMDEEMFFMAPSGWDTEDSAGDTKDGTEDSAGDTEDVARDTDSDDMFLSAHDELSPLVPPEQPLGLGTIPEPLSQPGAAVPQDVSPEPRDVSPAPQDVSPEPQDMSPEPQDVSPEPQDMSPEPQDMSPVPQEEDSDRVPAEGGTPGTGQGGGGEGTTGGGPGRTDVEEHGDTEEAGDMEEEWDTEEDGGGSGHPPMGSPPAPAPPQEPVEPPEHGSGSRVVPKSVPGSVHEVVDGSVPGSVPRSVPGSVSRSVHEVVDGSVPGSVPKVVPKSVPGFGPASVPSSVPGSVPELVPSSVPGSVHKVVTGSVPRVVPESVPGFVPTSVPSSIPSSVPASVPSSVPSSVPELVPSSVPGSVHEVVDGSVPGSVPRVVPESVPGFIPASVPSSVPELVPSSIPGSVPGSVHEVVAGSVPKVVPKSVPASVPGSVPELVPSSVPRSVPGSVPELVPMSVPHPDHAAAPPGSPCPPVPALRGDGSAPARLAARRVRVQHVRSVPVVPPKPQFARTPCAPPAVDAAPGAGARRAGWRESGGGSLDAALAAEQPVPVPVRRIQTYGGEEPAAAMPRVRPFHRGPRRPRLLSCAQLGTEGTTGER